MYNQSGSHEGCKGLEQGGRRRQYIWSEDYIAVVQCIILQREAVYLDLWMCMVMQWELSNIALKTMPEVACLKSACVCLCAAKLVASLFIWENVAS